MPTFSSPITHVVVLMLENHSFDHLLGYTVYPWSYLDRYDNRADPSEPSSTRFSVHPGAPYSLSPGPLHSVADVNVQLFGKRADASGGSQYRPSMDGFVWNYQNPPGRKQPAGDGRQLMACYTPQQVPVLSTLASFFTVCTNWFASVPGPTAPNRLFANCATSGGYAGGGYQFSSQPPPCGSGSPPGEAFVPMSLHGLPSIFERIDAMGDKHLTWGVHHEDSSFAPELVLDAVRGGGGAAVDPGFEHFREKVRSATLPNYTFLTPSLWHNSEHPSCDLRLGEWLIADIYECIRASDLWSNTLLIVTYDEHGGFFDHVPPTHPVPNPDGKRWSSTAPSDWCYTGPPFDFQRLGVRVPAVLVSAYTPALVDSTTYEHASIPATVKKLFNLPAFLTARDAHARTFESCIASSSVRDDAPLRLPRPAKERPGVTEPDAARLDEEKMQASWPTRSP